MSIKQYIESNRKNKINNTFKNYTDTDSDKLIEMYNICKKKNIESYFEEYLLENNLCPIFFGNVMEIISKVYHNQDLKKRIIEIAEQLMLKYTKKVYGYEIYSKIYELYMNNKLDLFSIEALSTYIFTKNIPSSTFNEILDLYTEHKLIGIHRTGGWDNAGETISNDGLKLTGHISSGIKSTVNTSMEDKLSENISFCNKIGTFLASSVGGANYKNLLEKKYVDIVITIIDNENDDNIIVENLDGEILNPEYIYGYLKVDVENNSIIDIIKNPNYINNIDKNRSTK